MTLPRRTRGFSDRHLGERRDRVRVASLDELALPRLLQALDGVLAEERVEVEPRFRAGTLIGIRRFDADEALVGQRLEPVEDVDPEIAVWIDDGQCELGAPAAGKDADPPEEPALRLAEQLVAPRDRAAERALALRARRESRQPRSRLEVRRSRMSAGLSNRTRAAASSMASGSPESRSQICRMTARASSSSTRSGRNAVARAVNSSTPASASSGGTAWPRSPEMRRSSRLVTSSRTAGAPRARVATMSAPAGSSCSRLSRRRSSSRSRRCSRNEVSTVAARRFAHAEGRRHRRTRAAPASRTAARSTNHVPCGNRSRSCLGDAKGEARLAAPAGPGQGQDPGRRRGGRAAWSTCSARPTSSVTSPGQVRRRVKRAQAAIVVGGAEDDESVEPCVAPRSP